MTITRVNPAGWTDDTSEITAAQINGIDTNTTYTADFAAGGTYTPAAPVIVGGSGIQLSGTDRLNYASRSTDVVQPLIGATCATADQFEYLTSLGSIRNNSGTGALLMLLLPNLPDGATLDEVYLHYYGAAGHAQDPVDDPGGITMPGFIVRRRAVNATAATDIGIATADNAGMAKATYEAAHAWKASGVAAAAHVIDNVNNNYFITFTAESGADYIANGTILGIVATVTITEQSEF